MMSRSECVKLLRGYFYSTARFYGVRRMALFGSVAREEHSGDSDVDVAYEGEPDLLLRCRIKRELETLFKCNVDVVRLRPGLRGTLFEDKISKDIVYV